MRMNRILEIVLRYAPCGSSKGITTEEVANLTGVMRHNASADLNELVRKGLLIKKNSRPVRFWAAKPAGTAADHSEAKVFPDAKDATDAETVFSNKIIGAEGSLRSIIEQAKAAMLYPPKGLPTLIVGSTGVGKSYLAEFMYFYAVQSGRLNPAAPFHVFNCADYAANPQLLLSQLFGYVKGAFTGAAQTTPGLVAQTENGVLFLDEIHRLPADGQEMLFLLMDRGVYRMLGDGASLRTASVTLIAATSENPRSALLSTLLRRFPVVITLPNLEERPSEERLALIDQFLQEEANRVGVAILVSPLVLVALLTFRTVGNVGELRSAVLLGCAKAFLQYIVAEKKPEIMPFYLTHLAPEIQLGYLQNHLDTLKAEHLVGVDDRIYMPSRQSKSPERPSAASDLYGELNQRIKGYLGSNLNPGEIKKLIKIDVDYYLRRLLGKAGSVSQLPPAGFLKVVAEFMDEAGRKLGYKFDPEATTGLAIHLASASFTGSSDPDRTMALVAHCSREYGVVQALAPLLQTKLGIQLSPEEMSYLAMLLNAHGRNTERGGLKILVIAHGDSTASSMAAVANQLLDDKRALAVDMPLNQSVDATLQQAVELIKECGKLSGILLLVDMGSLTDLGPTLEKASGIPVAVLSLVTTVAVIEAARLAGEADIELADVVQTVKQIYNNLEAPLPLSPEGKRVIITTCLTGQGTARKLAAFLSEALPADLRSQILIQPVDLKNGADIPALLVEGWRGKVVAVVGTVDPHLPGVPFIGMEQVLFGEGMETLISLSSLNSDSLEAEKSPSRQEAVALAERFVEDYIETEEGKRFAAAAGTALANLERQLKTPISTSQAARWIIHFAFALERLSTEGQVLECNEMAYLEQHHALLLEKIERAASPAAQMWNIVLPRGELGYLALIVLSA